MLETLLSYTRVLERKMSSLAGSIQFLKRGPIPGSQKGSETETGHRGNHNALIQFC